MADFRRGIGTFGLMWFAMFKALSSAEAREALARDGFKDVAVKPITSLHLLIVATK